MNILKMSDNFEDYDFTPTSNSTLASLFNSSSEIFENSNLTYTAPKQPRPEITTDTQSEVTKIDTTVICAKVVQVWKLADSKYCSVGKLGLAIIGSSVQTSYEIIIYKDKKNVIMRTKISTNLEVLVRKDNFCSFYDSAQEHWLIKFNNDEDNMIIINTIEKYGGKILKPEEKTIEKPKAQTAVENKITIDDEIMPENKAKADILTRIAKMGQSILPNKSIDLEEHLEGVDSFNKNLQTSTINTEINRQISVPNTSSTSNSTYITQPLMSMGVSNVPTFVMNQPIPYDPLSLYFTENRTHNNEVKINLTQISEKLNQIMKAVNTEKSNDEPVSDILKSKIKVLELQNENLLKELSSVQRENVNLKSQLQQQSGAITQQQAFKIRELQEEIKRLKETNLQLESYEESIAELSATVETQKSELEQLKNELATNRRNQKLNEEIAKLKNTISDLELKLKETEEWIDQHNTVNSNQDLEKYANFTSLLKEEMNGMFSNIVGNFNQNEPSNSEIGNIIAQNIKSTTLRIIQKFQQIFDIH